MATVDKAFADRLVAGNGYLDGDSDNSMGDNPRCIDIVKYTNLEGVDAFGVVFETDGNPWRYYYASEFIRNPVTYWRWAP